MKIVAQASIALSKIKVKASSQQLHLTPQKMRNTPSSSRKRSRMRVTEARSQSVMTKWCLMIIPAWKIRLAIMTMRLGRRYLRSLLRRRLKRATRWTRGRDQSQLWRILRSKRRRLRWTPRAMIFESRSGRPKKALWKERLVVWISPQKAPQLKIR